MSQVISLDVCKLRDSNENEVVCTLKFVERKKAKVQHFSHLLKAKVGNLRHENVLLDKQISYFESLNLKIEKALSVLKTKTENAACTLELVCWKMYKTEMLKEFENQRNETIDKRKRKYESFLEETPPTDNSSASDKLIYGHQNQNDENGAKILKEKINELTEEIESKKKSIQMTDHKLHLDITILQKRNAALLLRYQRQLQEVESRYRQTLYELNSLQKLSAEKNALLLNQRNT